MSTIESSLPEQLLQDNSVKTTQSKKELGQDAFLKLMLAQLEHQDPFQPLENGEFVAQMAQFSTVAGIEGMESSLKELSQSLSTNHLLQASTLIGRTALVPGNTASLSNESGITGGFELEDSAPSVFIDVHSQSGELVHRSTLGFTEAGIHRFYWDGNQQDGTKAPEGNYTITATHGSGDLLSPAPTFIEQQIKSVNLHQGSNAVSLETVHGEQYSMLDIVQIK